jgi:hypothetical protein
MIIIVLVTLLQVVTVLLSLLSLAGVNEGHNHFVKCKNMSDETMKIKIEYNVAPSRDN